MRGVSYFAEKGIHRQHPQRGEQMSAVPTFSALGVEVIEQSSSCLVECIKCFLYRTASLNTTKLVMI